MSSDDVKIQTMLISFTIPKVLSAQRIGSNKYFVYIPMSAI